MGAPAAVGVDNDLAASKTSVTLRAANDKETRGLDLWCGQLTCSKASQETYVVDSLVIAEILGNNLVDDLLLDLLSELLGGDVLAVLGRHNNSVDAKRDNGAAVVGILDGDLSFGVGPQPWQGAALAGLGHGRVELMGEDEGQGEQLRGLVGGIAKHDALVPGTKLLKGLVVVQALGNVGRLLLNGNKDVAGLVVEALIGRVVADFLDGVADDFLVVEVGLGGDLAKDHDHARLGGRLTGDLGERVFFEAGIEDGVGDLVAAGHG